LSGIDYFPVAWTVIAEVLSVAYLGWLALLERRFEASNARLTARVALTSIYAVDLAVVTLALTAGASLPWRLAPYLRLGLLVVSVDAIYDSFQQVMTVVPPFLNIAAMLALTVFFFGWLGAMTLDDFRFENHEGVMANAGFETFHDGLYTTFMATTTATVPDSFLPAYTAKRIFGLFFFLYEAMAVFIFLNLILAVVYNVYSDHVKERTRTYYANRSKGLAAAFNLLSSGGGGGGSGGGGEGGIIDKETFAALVAETNKVERVPTVTEGTVDWFFSVVDDDNSGAISASEFYDVCDILQYSFKRIKTKAWIQDAAPDWCRRHAATYDALKRYVVDSPQRLDRVVTAVLVINSALVLLESWFDLNNSDTPLGDLAFSYVEFLFSSFYAAALALELFVTPFDQFWLSNVNRFDFFVTVLLFLTALFWILPFVAVSSEVMHYLLILRLLRLVLLLTSMERFRILGAAIGRIVPASVGVLGVLFASASLWSTIGVQAFGGLLYDGNPALDDADDFLDAHFAILNVNDFAMGFYPLFAMIIAGGPFPELVAAFDKVAAFHGAGVLFFFSWYVVGVLIMVNVFSAFVIDAFLSQYEDDDEKVEHPDDELSSLDQSFAGEGYKIVAYKASTTDDVYKAMFADDLLEDDVSPSSKDHP